MSAFKSRRVSKRRETIYRHFVAAIDSVMLELGATKIAEPWGGEYPIRGAQWDYATPFGPLEICAYGGALEGVGWVPASFTYHAFIESWGFRHHKWNHHYWEPTDTPESAAADYRHVLERLQHRNGAPTAEQLQAAARHHAELDARWAEAFARMDTSRRAAI